MGTIQFAELAKKIGVPVLVVDDTGTILFANDKCLAELPKASAGENIKASFSKGSVLLKRLDKLSSTKVLPKLKLQTKGQVSREYNITASALETPPHDGARFLLTLEDLTPLRLAKSMRSDFVANVSHEIRSPLTAISGFVESLQDADDIDDETRALFLGLMAKEVDRMTNLVSDLLSLSQVEVKERKALKRSADIRQILLHACETVSVLAAESGKDIDVQIRDSLPEVLGKTDDLVRVFINLLENAINYSRPKSTIQLKASISNKSNPLRKKAICIAVTDESDGIAEAEIPRLTERFYRVDKSRSRNVGGTGLGLAIVKHILVRHRGKLVIESTQGRGSTFSVYLPIPLS